jgi:hypothetical protein
VNVAGIDGHRIESPGGNDRPLASNPLPLPIIFDAPLFPNAHDFAIIFVAAMRKDGNNAKNASDGKQASHDSHPSHRLGVSCLEGNRRHRGNGVSAFNFCSF